MADVYTSSEEIISDEQSFYNVMRVTGRGMTPMWDSLGNAEPFDGSPKTGHIWFQTVSAHTGVVNKHLEGGIRADVETPTEIQLVNHLQIFKKTYGITKSEKAATSRVTKKALERSKDNSILQLRLDVEAALCSAAAPVQRTATVAGVMGGLLHYISYVIDGTNTVALSYELHIEAALKKMWEEGVLEDKIILCGTGVRSKINAMMDGFRIATNNDTKFSKNVTEIADAGWARNVKIESSTNLAINEFIVYAPDLVNPVLLRQEKDNIVTDFTYDSEAWENLFEMTLQVDDPYAAVYVKNIKLN